MITKNIETNGFEFLVTDDYFTTSVVIDLKSETLTNAIADNNPKFISALQELVKDADEIDSILTLKGSQGMWEQKYADNLKTELGKIKDSKYVNESTRESLNKWYEAL